MRGACVFLRESSRINCLSSGAKAIPRGQPEQIMKMGKHWVFCRVHTASARVELGGAMHAKCYHFIHQNRLSRPSGSGKPVLVEKCLSFDGRGSGFVPPGRGGFRNTAKYG